MNRFLDDEPEEVEEYIGRRILVPGSRLMVFGPAGVGKTILVENMAFALAKGDSWVGFDIPKPRRVIYLQSEVSDDYFWQRTTQMEEHYGIRNTTAAERLFLHRDVDLRLDRQAGFDKVSAWLELVRPDVLIVDPFYMYCSVSDTDLAGTKKFVTDVNLLIEKFKIAFVLVHNSRQEQRDQMGRGYNTGMGEARGSTVLTQDWPDVSIQFRRQKDGFTLSCEKSRNGPTWPSVQVRLDEEHLLIVPAMAFEDTVLGMLRGQTEGVPKKWLKKAVCEDMGIAPATFERHWEKLKATERVLVEPRGNEVVVKVRA